MVAYFPAPFDGFHSAHVPMLAVGFTKRTPWRNLGRSEAGVAFNEGETRSCGISDRGCGPRLILSPGAFAGCTDLRRSHLCDVCRGLARSEHSAQGREGGVLVRPAIGGWTLRHRGSIAKRRAAAFGTHGTAGTCGDYDLGSQRNSSS